MSFDRRRRRLLRRRRRLVLPNSPTVCRRTDHVAAYFIRARCRASAIRRAVQPQRRTGGIEVEVAGGGLDDADPVSAPRPAAQRRRRHRRRRVAGGDRRRSMSVGGRAAAGDGGQRRRARPSRRRRWCTMSGDGSRRQPLETTQLLGKVGALEAVTVTIVVVR